MLPTNMPKPFDPEHNDTVGTPEQEQIKSLKDRIRELEAACSSCYDAQLRGDERIRELEVLLKVAKCPNDSCTDGAIPHGPDPDGNWEAEQCQWCYERAALLEKQDDHKI